MELKLKNNTDNIAVLQYTIIDGNVNYNCVEILFGEETFKVFVYDENDCTVKFVVNYICCRGIYEYAGCEIIDETDEETDWTDVAGYVSSFILEQKELGNI